MYKVFRELTTVVLWFVSTNKETEALQVPAQGYTNPIIMGRAFNSR